VACEIKPQELIVVADGADSQDIATAQDFGAQVLQISTTSGPAAARNWGAIHASGDIVLFLDADVIPAPDILTKVAAAFDGQGDLAALFGSYDDAPGESNFFSQYKNLLHHFTHQSGREEAFTFWAGCGAIRREIFLALGGFDEAAYRRPSIEDIELGYRLRSANLRIRLYKDIQVKHLKRWGPISLFKTDFFQRALPWTDLILRAKRSANDLNLNAASRVSVVMVYLMIGASFAGFFVRSCFWLIPIAALFFLVMNWPLYRFFARTRGFWFAACTIPIHGVYYFYSGLAFGIGCVARLVRVRRHIVAPAVPLKSVVSHATTERASAKA
jgi:glycosyltransferase involved in cell wall biosynthesis